MSLQNQKKQPINERATKLRKLLKKRGITQEKAAERLGVTRMHLNMVLNSRRKSEPLLNRIEKILEKN